MTEDSYFWSDSPAVGDGVLSPYDDDEWSDLDSLRHVYDRTNEGVILTADPSYNGLLFVTNPSGNTIRVASGACWVDGKTYRTDAAVDVNVAPLADGTYYVVVRKSWAAQTVRLMLVSSIVKTNGTTWDISLATITVAGGVITVVADTRYFVHFAGKVQAINYEAASIPDTALDFGTLVNLREDILAAESTIDWTGIPATYTHLKIMMLVKSANALLDMEGIRLRFNNDSGANYEYTDASIESNETVDASSNLAQTAIQAGVYPTEKASPSVFGIIKIEIPYYANAAAYKYVDVSYSCVAGTGAGKWYPLGHAAGVWKSNSAINRITMDGILGTGGERRFSIGSVFNLYGMS